MSEDTPLIRADPAAFAAAMERTKIATFEPTVAILASRQGGLEFVGSGVLVAVCDLVFVATCAHVVDAVRERGAVPAIVAGNDEAEPIRILPFESAESDPKVDRRQDRVDVAVLPLARLRDPPFAQVERRRRTVTSH